MLSAFSLFLFVNTGFLPEKKTKSKTSVKSQVIQKVKDADSNEYSVVIIGKQMWMDGNLRTTRFSNGKSIAEVKDSSRWTVFNSPAYCKYNNDTSLKPINGNLYNWYAAADSQNICPKGWKVPTDEDWRVLEEFLGGASMAGGKLKDTVANEWLESYGNSNESGFKGNPSGCRTNKGTFNSFGYYGLWWSATENYSTYAWYRSINYSSTELFRHYYYKRYGFSVRCLKN
mgnify:CR=1 FL=1